MTWFRHDFRILGVVIIFLTCQASAIDCCSVKSTAGCANSTIETCVCLARPSCCSQAWDLNCVNQINSGRCSSVTCPSGGCIATCGNGVKECDEQCDLGAANSDTGACTSSCTTAYCGDGKVYAGVEQCDNGASNSNTTANACRLTCKRASCGDNVVDAGEICDFGSNTACCVFCAGVPGQCAVACANATHGLTTACSTGACSAKTYQKCSPYICQGQAGCGTSCVTSDDCAGGNVCTGSLCISTLASQSVTPSPASLSPSWTPFATGLPSSLVDGLVATPTSSSVDNVALTAGLAAGFGVVALLVIGGVVYYLVSKSRREKRAAAFAMPTEKKGKKGKGEDDEEETEHSRMAPGEPVSPSAQLQMWAGRDAKYQSDTLAHVKRSRPRLLDSSSSLGDDFFSGSTELDFDFTTSAGTW